MSPDSGEGTEDANRRVGVLGLIGNLDAAQVYEQIDGVVDIASRRDRVVSRTGNGPLDRRDAMRKCRYGNERQPSPHDDRRNEYA